MGKLRSAIAPLGVVLCALAPISCKEVQYKAATVHDEVVAIGTKTVPSGQDAGVAVNGTRLRIQVARLCNVVEDKEVARKHVQESDEDVTLEAVLIGLAAIPIAVGAGVLADAPRVYDRDVNQRLYNATGKSSAYTLGGLAVGLGATMLIPAAASLVRRKKSKVDEETAHEPGDTVELGVPCHDQASAAGVQVDGRLDNGRSVVLGHTGSDGRLQVDLVGVLVPSELGGPDQPGTMDMSIAGQSYALIDLEPALDVHAARREKQWRDADPRRCDIERTEEACAAVRQFAQLFPKSSHAREANALIANIGKFRRIPQ